MLNLYVCLTLNLILTPIQVSRLLEKIVCTRLCVGVGFARARMARARLGSGLQSERDDIPKHNIQAAVHM